MVIFVTLLSPVPTSTGEPFEYCLLMFDYLTVLNLIIK
ncbi:hypothetical protein PCC8801_2131 [Rippkaea orientalis PCC 8801]|uniref:Uncharacterized protein n=1 Tax=Rippkaea orientalis (strain PCC 8801 / RF-1) TaxID=41431 RepID=B7K016_RIPO1|nr:hypothetical protein PCC8801_2131 [Rippkaea orientalis PCC 8801]